MYEDEDVNETVVLVVSLILALNHILTYLHCPTDNLALLFLCLVVVNTISLKVVFRFSNEINKYVYTYIGSLYNNVDSTYYEGKVFSFLYVQWQNFIF